ncbi:MAG: hypothetical protein P8163_08785 [Candidatus Thiodiazotropha sp.]
MPLNTAVIKSRLAAASSSTKDNEAQDIIKGATPAELQALDVEGVLRLFEALAMLSPRIYSSHDSAAMKKLATHTQFQPITNTPAYGIGLIKSSKKANPIIQSELTPSLITRIYAAERKRLSVFERVGIDGDTIGRGQLGQAAYTDVKSAAHFKAIWEEYLTRNYLAKALSQYDGNPRQAAGFNMKTYTVIIPPQYGAVWKDPVQEDFVVAAYVAIRLSAATKPKRSSKDAARFAIALYHGMRSMVVAAQTAVKDTINWQPVEAELLSKGYSDEVAYVNEVVK